MAAGFRSYVWDPCLIISQIVAVQCVFYLFLAFWILLVDFWTGSTRSLDQFFRPVVSINIKINEIVDHPVGLLLNRVTKLLNLRLARKCL